MKKSKIWIVIIFNLLLLNCLVNYTVLADTEEEENYSEAYKKYLSLSQEEKDNIYVIPRKYIVPMPENDTKRNLRANPLPSSYILTGKDTNNDGVVDSEDIVAEKYGNLQLKLEDQGGYGLCWAFASINTLETNLALHGYGMNDYSELHLDYMEYLYGDYDRELHGGGNFYNFMSYQNRKDGVVLESEVPYDAVYYAKDIDYLNSLEQRAVINKYVEMPTIDKYNNDYYTACYRYSINYEPVELTDEILLEFRNKVKNQIMNNGSVFAVIDSEEMELSTELDKYVLNGKTDSADHAISIIGWDDNFSRYNFPERCRPEKDGAYIALNTWTYRSGSYFFYISYEDFLVEEEMVGIEDAYTVDTTENNILKGWQLINNKWYYYNNGSVIKSTWMKIDGTWYYFDGNGIAVTGWKSIGGKWYYFDGNCKMLTGWRYIGNVWYYFDGSGAAVTGWKSIGGKWYYFDGNCKMLTGWQYIGKKWYYFESSGSMFNGTKKVINGKTNYFDKSGAWIR